MKLANKWIATPQNLTGHDLWEDPTSSAGHLHLIGDKPEYTSIDITLYVPLFPTTQAQNL